MFHPLIKILALLLLAASIYRFSFIELSLVTCILLIALWSYRIRQYLPMLKRMRWLLIAMFMIYAYSTPGEYLNSWPFDSSMSHLAPTYEGLIAGLLQMTRLVAMLALVALVMGTTSKTGLIEGFYSLLKPLRYLGISPERFSARLTLTLQYIEVNNKAFENQASIKKLQFNWQQFLNADRLDIDKDLRVIDLNITTLRWIDYLILIIMLVLFIFKWMT
jgi:energy-coupling factor transporter transmembrane protein EcfT